MNEYALSRFSALMLTLGRYYNKTLSTDMLDTYWQALKPWPWEAIEKAVHVHISDPGQRRFFPSPAVLMAALPDTTPATQAWQQVRYAIQHVGCYGSVVFEDKRIHLAIQALGGWCHVCQQPTAQLAMLSVAFRQQFNAIPHPMPPAPARLTGFMPAVVVIKPMHPLSPYGVSGERYEPLNQRDQSCIKQL